MKKTILLLLAVFLLTGCAVKPKKQNKIVITSEQIAAIRKKNDTMIYFDYETSMQGADDYLTLSIKDVATYSAKKQKADILYRQKKYKEALKVMKEIVNDESSSDYIDLFETSFYRQLYLIYSAVGDTLNANITLKEKLLRPNYRTFYRNTERILFQKQFKMIDENKFLADLEEAKKLNLFEKNVRSKYYAGIINYLDGNNEKSLYYFENLDYFRENASAVFKVPAYLFKAMFLLRLNRTEEAKECYLQALKYKKEHESVRNITVPIEEYIGHIDYVVATPKMLNDIKKLKKLVSNQ